MLPLPPNSLQWCSHLLNCAFCKSVAKKSSDRILKISFVETLGSCNWLSTTSQSERMTFHPDPKRALWRKRCDNLGLRLLTNMLRACSLLHTQTVARNPSLNMSLALEKIYSEWRKDLSHTPSPGGDGKPWILIISCRQLSWERKERRD